MYQLHAIRTAYLVTRDLALAEDIVQTAFVRVYERIGQFDARRPFGPWFLKVVVNDAIKAAQRHERHVALNDHTTADRLLVELLADAEPGSDYLVEQAEIQRTVWAALGKLPPEQRAVIVRRYYLQMSEADITNDLEYPPSTIKWRLHVARKRLRTLLRALRPEADADEPKQEARRMTVE